MVRGVYSFFGVSEILFLKENKYSKRYCELLKNGLLPFALEVFWELHT